MRRLADRLGRRGTVLLVLGCVWIVYGWAVHTTPHSVGALGILDKLPTGVWVAMWVASGLVGIAHCGTPRARDGLGFTALVIPPAVWAFGLWWTWLAYLLPALWPFSLLPGNPYGWAGGIIWTGLTVVIVTVAGWIEPPR